jgi:uncharacterized protein YqcC (DUF446 family)
VFAFSFWLAARASASHYLPIATSDLWTHLQPSYRTMVSRGPHWFKDARPEKMFLQWIFLFSRMPSYKLILLLQPG